MISRGVIVNPHQDVLHPPSLFPSPFFLNSPIQFSPFFPFLSLHLLIQIPNRIRSPTICLPLLGAPPTKIPKKKNKNKKQKTMSSSAPPVLPISNPQTATGGATADSQAPASNPAFRAFISRFTESLRHGLSERRPWGELVDRTAFSKPETLAEATFRIRKNYTYFRVNYIAIVVLILVISLLTNPFSLVILLGLSASWMFLYLFRPSDQPLVILGRTFSDFETLALLGVLTVFVVFLTSVGSLLVSAVMGGVVIVCAHGAFRVPEDLFLDEQETSQSTGFLSIIRGAAANAAVAAATNPVPARG